MTTSITMPYDEEANRRRLADLLKGWKDGYVGEVAMGTRVVRVPSPRPPVAAGPEGSYTARKLEESRSSPVPPHDDDDEPPPAAEKALLLDKVHGYHLKALAVLGKDGVRRHARGLVFAGYAYGLLPDPVANVISNALWYDATFPPSSSSRREEAKMLSAQAVFRMACRSLDALIAFVRHFAPALSTREVWSCLAGVNGDLQLVVALLDARGVGLGDQQGGFRAAVQASDLPNEAVREAHLSFVTRHDSVRDLLTDPRLRCIIQSIHSSLNPVPRVPCQPYTAAGGHAMGESAGVSASSTSTLSPSAHRALRIKMHYFRLEEELCLDIVQLALQKLASQHGEPYELHMICGRNYIIMPPKIYHHINFLASPEGCSNSPTLFFADVRASHKDVNDVTLCCPLTEEKGRCFACDTKGVKLIHPADVKFNGAEDRIGDYSLMTDPTSDFAAPLNED